MEYNDIIKKLRVEAGMTQQQLADEVGVSRQSVARWENGWNVPSLFYAQKLSGVFGVSVSELMTGEERAAAVDTDGIERNNHAPIATKRPPAMLFSAIWACVLSVAVLILQQVLEHVFGVASGTNRTLWSALRALNDCVCGIALSLLALWWVLKIVKFFYADADKFARCREYRAWSVGLYLLIISLTVYVYNIVSFVSLYLPLIYAGAAAATFPINFAINFTIKKALSKRMTVEMNRALDIVNLVFAIIFGVCAVALAVFFIYAAVKWSPTDGLAIGFAILYFTCVSVLVMIAYAVTRIVVRSVQNTQASK